MTDLQRDGGLGRWYASLDLACLEFAEDVPVPAEGWPWRSALVLAALVVWWWVR